MITRLLCIIPVLLCAACSSYWPGTGDLGDPAGAGPTPVTPTAEQPPEPPTDERADQQADPPAKEFPAEDQPTTSDDGLAPGVLDEPPAPPTISDKPARGVWRRSFPPPAQVPAVSINAVGDDFSVNSADHGLLRTMSPVPLFDPAGPCNVTVERRPAPNGYDLVYTITNPTDAPQVQPRMQLTGQILSGEVKLLSHRMGIEWAALEQDQRKGVFSSRDRYPRELYAPVIVARDARVAVGVSLQFPALAYRHEVEISVARLANDPANQWRFRFKPIAELPPAAERTYTMTVRYMPPEDWIHTLEPYREYFQANYGSHAKYTQDMRPVWSVFASTPERIGPGNPRGFGTSRPDTAGWAPLVNTIASNLRKTGFRRVMIWTPSGCYGVHRNRNFPSLIMSEWSEAQEATNAQWRRIQAMGVQLCFWWGNSARLAAQWDPPSTELFNPGDPDQRLAMMNEYQLLVARGADGVGLDAIRPMPLWDMLPWIDWMQQQKPDVYIVAEPSVCDIAHLHVPMFVQSADLPIPHTLADYLVPGREIWAFCPSEVVHNRTRVLQLVSWGMTIATRDFKFAATSIERQLRQMQSR